jgi:hypothetical protein
MLSMKREYYQIQHGIPGKMLTIWVVLTVNVVFSSQGKIKIINSFAMLRTQIKKKMQLMDQQIVTLLQNHGSTLLIASLRDYN